MESGTVGTSTQTESSNGAAVAAAAETLEVLNPATGEPIANLPIDGPDAVAATVARVRAAQPDWEAMGIEGRYHWLGKLRDWLLDNSDRVLDTMQRETGKVRADASNEPTYLADTINFYGTQAAKFIGEESVRPHSPLLAAKKLRVQYRPYPVVGIISPWNFPLILSLGDAIPALMAGAAVVIKPSEFTPLGIAEVAEAWKHEIGGPDVFDVVQGIGETGGALVDAVDYIQFTGSDRTGRKVMARAAETLTPVSLELGGKDPMIVLADADLDRAANAAAWGGMFNSRPGLHLGRADLRRGARLRRVRRQADRRGRPHAPGRRRRPRPEGRRRDDLPQPDRDRRGPGRRRARQRRPRADRRQARPRPRRLLRTDRAGRRRPLDEGDARRDLRPGRRGDEGARRRGGAAPRQRHPLRALRLGLRRARATPNGSPAGSSAAPSTSTTCWSTTSPPTCRWAAGRSRGSATATAPRGSASSAAPSRS